MNCKDRLKIDLKYCHLHDDELQEQRQSADVTGRQIKQEGCVPNRIRSTGALRLFSADDFTVLTQVDYNIVIYTNKYKNCMEES